MKAFKVKIIKGTTLQELKGQEVNLLLNEHTGNLELARPKAELPFYGISWNEISEISYETKGMLKKALHMHITTKKQEISLEIKEKIGKEEIETEVTKFIQQAKTTYPNGGIQKALEPLKEVIKHLKKAQSAIEEVTKKTTNELMTMKNKATKSIIDVKDKATTKIKKHEKNTKKEA